MAIVKPILNDTEFQNWVASRPPIIQKMIASHPPDRLYRMSESGHRVTIHSYCEDGTVTVNVTGEYNRVIFSRNVFGVKLDNLTECDLPDEGEDVGDTSVEAGLSDEDVNEVLIPNLRSYFRQQS